MATKIDMKMKIGRNDPCYCGSGKKYKKCCMIRENRSNIPWKEYPEKYVLKEILGQSETFIKYYEIERPKIRDTVKWVEDKSLPAGIDYRSTRLPRGEEVIRLRNVPATEKDSTKIAHELQHLVMDYEGFPCTGARDEYETISSALNSIVHDLIVNERLMRYGFDLKEDFKREIEEDVRQLKKQKESPKDRIGRFHWACNYVSKVLDYNLIFRNESCNDDEFFNFFRDKYPDIVEESSEMQRIIKEIGYDTPEKQYRMFREIISTYNLQGIIII